MKFINFRRWLILSIFLLALFNAVSAQNETSNLLEKVELTFSLSGEPAPADVGFDNPKSSWKLKYELYLTDFAELEKIGRCHKDEVGRHICLPVFDKKIDKRIRKISTKIRKGNFARKSLINESNREVVISINLSPEIVEIFNQAVKAPDKNPTFVLFVTTRASTKNSAKAKFRKKYSVSGIKPLKLASSNKTSEYWNVKVLSLHLTITKEEDGQLKGFNSLIH